MTVCGAILLDWATDDDDEQHSQEEGQQHSQNDLLFSGQKAVHYTGTFKQTTSYTQNNSICTESVCLLKKEI